jgi:hypothetical protein
MGWEVAIALRQAGRVRDRSGLGLLCRDKRYRLSRVVLCKVFCKGTAECRGRLGRSIAFALTNDLLRIIGSHAVNLSDLLEKRLWWGVPRGSVCTATLCLQKIH